VLGVGCSVRRKEHRVRNGLTILSNGLDLWFTLQVRWLLAAHVLAALTDFFSASLSLPK
jgi:hypothetical protein